MEGAFKVSVECGGLGGGYSLLGGGVTTVGIYASNYFLSLLAATGTRISTSNIFGVVRDNRVVQANTVPIKRGATISGTGFNSITEKNLLQFSVVFLPS